MRRTLLILAIGTGLSGTALAQEAARMPSGQNLDSAGQFRNITSTGVTKPPGGGGGPSESRNAEPTAKQRAMDRKVDTGICIGCN